MSKVQRSTTSGPQASCKVPGQAQKQVPSMGQCNAAGGPQALFRAPAQAQQQASSKTTLPKAPTCKGPCIPRAVAPKGSSFGPSYGLQAPHPPHHAESGQAKKQAPVNAPGKAQQQELPLHGKYWYPIVFKETSKVLSQGQSKGATMTSDISLLWVNTDCHANITRLYIFPLILASSINLTTGLGCAQTYLYIVAVLEHFFVISWLHSDTAVRRSMWQC